MFVILLYLSCIYSIDISIIPDFIIFQDKKGRKNYCFLERITFIHYERQKI